MQLKAGPGSTPMTLTQIVSGVLGNSQERRAQALRITNHVARSGVVCASNYGTVSPRRTAAIDAIDTTLSSGGGGRVDGLRMLARSIRHTGGAIIDVMRHPLAAAENPLNPKERIPDFVPAGW